MSEQILCLTEIKWCEVGLQGEQKGEPLWSGNLTCPTQGEVRWAQLYVDRWPDGDVEAGQNRWLFFQPGWSLANGFSEYPEEMDVSAVVEAELLEVLVPPSRSFHGSRKQRMDNVWVRVRCLQVVPLLRIPEIFPLIAPTQKRASELLVDAGATLTNFQTQTPFVTDWFIITNERASRRVFPQLVFQGQFPDSYGWIVNWPVEVSKNSWKVR